MIEFGVLVAVGTFGVSLATMLLLRRLPTLRLQLAGLALLAVVLPLGAVLVSGLVMFHMGTDTKILAVASASALAAVAAALLLSRSISSAVARVGDASTAIAAGDLSARAPTDGPHELAELARGLNSMATSIEELFDARRQLVAWASHDLRTPLASLQAMLEALEDGLGDVDRYLPAMREQVTALGALVEDLFELARIDAGALSFELEETRVELVVESCLRGLEAEARARRVALEARVAPGTPSALCAPAKVERVLQNLLANALRHTPSDGSVAVLVRGDGAELVVAVEDTGDGLDVDAPRRMFDRFWRADPARVRDGGGAGLGLAIARGLVEAQGGRIWAENRPDGGARIAFTLPAV